MLYLLPYAMDLLRIVAVILEGPLGNNPTSVQDGIHIMDGDAVHLDSVRDGLLDRMGAAESREEGRMDIDDAAAVGAKEDVSDYPHITRKADKVNPLLIKELHYLLLISGLASGIGLGREDEGRNAVTLRLGDDGRSGHIAYHDLDASVDNALGTGLGYGLEIGASPAGKDCQLFHFIMISTPGVSVTRPMTDAFSPYDSRMEIAFSASEASRTATMPIPMLKILNISR